MVTEGHSDEETEKRLAAAILSGAPAILLDNLQRTLSSSTLESGLTEGTATIRLFGRLVDVTVPVTALVLVTANNAALRADMLRRTLPVRIVADTDRPELRRFAFDPYQEAARRRREIVAAALTIARAWWCGGRDSAQGHRIRQTTLGSFEVWAELVAGAVEWLTGMNPVTLIEERKAEDPMRGAERRVIAALHDLFGERPWTAKEAIGKPADLGRRRNRSGPGDLGGGDLVQGRAAHAAPGRHLAPAPEGQGVRRPPARRRDRPRRRRPVAGAGDAGDRGGSLLPAAENCRRRVPVVGTRGK